MPLESPGTSEALVRLAVAVVGGLVIGLERERREKAAGLRTLTLVSVGSATFVLASLMTEPREAVRMAAGIATGVGFLGAGAILRERGEVTGLTTAATVWIAAALGIAAAMGSYVLAVLATSLTLFVLTVLGLIDLSQVQQDARTYEVAYDAALWEEAPAAACLKDAGLRVNLLSAAWSQTEVVASWRAVGRRQDHERGMACLHASESVTSFTVRT